MDERRAPAEIIADGHRDRGAIADAGDAAPGRVRAVDASFAGTVG